MYPFLINICHDFERAIRKGMVKHMALNNKAIGQRIKYYRTERGLSQEELAEMIFTTREHLSRLESGLKVVSLELLILIANTLKVSANDLLLGNLEHSGSEVDKELHEIFFDCNQDEKGILMKTLRFLKALLSEYGV